MRKEDCFYLGSVSKTYSFRGEVIVFIDDRDPQKYDKMESVFVEINNKLVPFFIEKIRFDRSGPYARVQFEGVDSEAAAQALVKKELFLPLTMRPESEDDDELFPEDLIGYSVTDTALGLLGTVESFIEHTTNPILEVNGDRGEILIPFHDQFIVEIDHEAKSISVEIPEGLIGLND